MAEGGRVGKKRLFLDEVARRAASEKVRPGKPGEERYAFTRGGRQPAKPHIDDVCALFHAFRTETSRIMRLHRPMSVEMVRAFDDAKAKLKTGLDVMGLGDLIDWRDRS